MLIDEAAVRPAYLPKACRVKHVLTHQVLYADLYFYAPTVRPQLPAGYQWVDEADLARYALPRLVEKLLAMV